MIKAFAILLLVIPFLGISQEDESWMMMESSNKIEGDSSKVKVNFNSDKKGNVNVKVDPRVKQLITKMATCNDEGGCIDGYRVQIFFDTDKSKTNSEKARFKTRYGNSISCYVEYKAPNYRIKVGDFRTEIEAEKYKQSLLSVFPTAFVVQEKIKLPSLGNNSGNED